MKKIYILLSFLLISSFGFGQNWQRADYEGHFGDLELIETHKGNIYLASVQGVIRSDDNGITWQNQTTPLVFVNKLTSNDNALYIAGQKSDNLDYAIFVSFDKGENWLNIYTVPQNDGLIHTIDVQDNTIFISEFKNMTNLFHIRKSEDNGLTWIEVGTVPPVSVSNVVEYKGLVYVASGTQLYSNAGGNFVEFSSVDFGVNFIFLQLFNNRLYVAGDGLWYQESHDDFISAIEQQDLLGSGVIVNNKLYFIRPRDKSIIEVNANNEITSFVGILPHDNAFDAADVNNQLAIITNENLYLSDIISNETIWQTLSDKTSKMLTNFRKRLFYHKGQVFFGNESNFYQSSDNGQSFIRRNTNIEFTNAAVNTNQVAAVFDFTEKIEVQSSINDFFDAPTRPLIQFNGFSSFTVIDDIIVLGEKFYAVSRQNGFMVSDNGLNWEIKNNGLPSVSEFNFIEGALFPYKNSLLFRTTQDSEAVYYRSFDKGESWTEFYRGDASSSKELRAVSDRLFRGLSEYSDDDGVTWQNMSLPLGSNGSNIIEYGKLLIANYFTIIYISNNGGETWSQVSGNQLLEGAFNPQRGNTIISGENLIVNLGTDGLYYISLRDLGIEPVLPENLAFSETVVGSLDTLVITGKNFVPNSMSQNEVIFGDTHAQIVYASIDTLKVIVPEVEGTFFPVIKSRNLSTTSSIGITITITTPGILSFSPTEVSPGDELTINGRLFDPSASNNVVTIGGISIPVTSASATQIKVTIPEILRSSSPQTITLVTGEETLTSPTQLSFSAPSILSLMFNSAFVGDEVDITVGGLSSNPNLNEVFLGDNIVNSQNLGSGILRISVPNLPSGTYELKVKVNELFSEPVNFEVRAPSITSVTPSADLLPGNEIIIAGENLNSNNGIIINGIELEQVMSFSNDIIAIIPEALRGSKPQYVTVDVKGIIVSSPKQISFRGPSIDSPTPDSAFPNTQIGLRAVDASPIAGRNEVYFGETIAVINMMEQSPSDENVIFLDVTVPEELKGNVDLRLKVGDQFSNTLQFGILTPEINNFLPLTASEGDTVTVFGKNLSFNNNINNLSIFFGDIEAEIISLTSFAREAQVIVPSGLQGPVKISVSSRGLSDISNAFFTIKPPFITIDSPNGGESFQPGDNMIIEFTSNAIGLLNIELLKDGIKVRDIISSITKNDSPFSWRIPNAIELGTDYRIRITNSDNLSIRDDSNGDFSIEGTPIINWGTPSDIEVQTNNNATVEISLTTEVVEVASMEIEYFSLRDSSNVNRRDVTPGANSRYNVTIPSSAIDELGVAYRFIAKFNNETTSTRPENGWYYEYTSYPNDGLTIPYTNYGSSDINYEMISTPLNLSVNSIEGAFGGTDKLGNYGETEDWVMYTYGNNQNAQARSFNQLQSGVGYWLIARQGPAGGIPSGVGSAIEAYDGNPHTISVNQGFNLIGNPYPFSITLQDLQNANPSLSIAGFKTYNRGFNDNQTILNIGEGAFIQVPEGVNTNTLVFPVNSNNNGRFSANYFQSKASLDASEWIVNLDLQSGELINHVAGIGMHTQASQGKDLFDQKVMPKFFTYLQATFKGSDITKDIVSTQKEYTWEFEVESTTDYPTITLSWENDYFGEHHNKTLILEDAQSGRIINMAESNSYTFSNEKRIFKIHFGDKEELDNNLLPSQWNVFEPFPVPFNNQLTIPIALPERGEVVLELYDVQGKQVGSQILEFSKAGYHEIMIQNETASQLSKGVYLYRVGFKNQWLSGKLSKE